MHPDERAKLLLLVTGDPIVVSEHKVEEVNAAELDDLRSKWFKRYEEQMAVIHGGQGEVKYIGRGELPRVASVRINVRSKGNVDTGSLFVWRWIADRVLEQSYLWSDIGRK